MATAIGGIFGVVIIALCIIIAILWILMPFAIFGSKDLLHELIREQQKTNRLLEAQASRGASVSGLDPTLRAER